MLGSTESRPRVIEPPIRFASREFAAHKHLFYEWMLAEAPVCRGSISVMKLYAVSRHEDCTNLMRDPRFVRNRTTATGGRRLPFPLPKSARMIAESMIVEDDPEHARLRGLVHKAFTPGALARLEGRIERLTHELLDDAEKRGSLDLQQAYCLPIPVTVIGEMLGLEEEDLPRLRHSLSVLSNGLSGWSLLRTLAWDLGKVGRFVREIIARKRENPADDILTGLIQAEEAGDRLSEDELVGMVVLLAIAGFETTVHLITNGVLALLQHPDQLQRLRAEASLLESAVEEILRFAGPIHASKPNYAMEDVELHGVTVPKGSAVVPVFGAANIDPRIFEKPLVFDIARSPNRHLGFGYGSHFCLGAALARMETRVALKNLFDRNPNLRITVGPEELHVVNMPFWNRLDRLPVAMG